MAFEWKDEYKVGIGVIDTQHRRLFEIGAQVDELASLHDGYDRYDDIMRILSELIQYTQYHFSSEEVLLEKYGYPDFENHKMQHFFLMKKLERVDPNEVDSDQEQAVLDIVHFLSDWISGHILSTDHKYIDFLRGKGVE